MRLPLLVVPSLWWSSFFSPLKKKTRFFCIRIFDIVMKFWNNNMTLTWSTVSHGSFCPRLKHVFCFPLQTRHLVGIYNVVRGVHQLGGPRFIYSKHTICSDVSRCCLQRWPPLLGPQCVGEAEGRCLARHSGWATSWIRGWRFTSCLDNV